MRSRFTNHTASTDQLLCLGKKILSETEVDKVLELSIDNVLELTPAERGLIILFDTNGEIIFKTARNLSKSDIANPKFEVSRTIIERVRLSGEPLWFHNAMREPILKSSQSTIRLRILSVACIPLVSEDTIIGVIYLDNKSIEKAFKKETYEFLIDFADFISTAANNALKSRRLQNKVSVLESELRGKYHFESIIGHHPKMIEILKLLGKVAIIDATVLIQGESGTGKELIAKALHFNSSRNEKPFIPINCGAIPENLLESELFGHVRGAFTGAISNKIGWFERADGGTIFLDEISEMSPALQVKLLRILQSGEFHPVGSSEIKYCNVRIIAATNKDLLKLISREKFRDDLYYRLNIIDINLPPLRERRSDLPFLIQHFLRIYSEKYVKKGLYFSDKTKRLLSKYDFPGNVRELENIIQRAVALVEGNIIETKHLQANVNTILNSTPSNEEIENFKNAKNIVLEKFESDYVTECLRATKGNITHAAEIAGIQYANFHKKVKKYNINPADLKNN